MGLQFSSVHSLSCVWLFVNPWITARQASLSITNSWSLLKLMSVTWVLGSITKIKGSGSDGIPAELFQILKDDTVKVLHSICQQIWKTQQHPQDWEMSAFTSIPEKGNAKNSSNYGTIVFIPYNSKVVLRLLQSGLNSTWTSNSQVYKLDLEKAEEPQIKLPASIGS